MAGRTKERGPRWKADEAREVLAQWRRSGMSAAAFARERGLSSMRLSYWAKQLGSEPTAPVQFVPVALGAASNADAVIEIAHGGVTLRVRESLDAEHVGQLCAALVRAVRPC